MKSLEIKLVAQDQLITHQASQIEDLRRDKAEFRLEREELKEELKGLLVLVEEQQKIMKEYQKLSVWRRLITQLPSPDRTIDTE